MENVLQNGSKRQRIVHIVVLLSVSNTIKLAIFAINSSYLLTYSIVSKEGMFVNNV
jgi:hypothetical protein